MRRVSISIDGLTASGKTSLGRSLAETLRAAFLDTGLTFRAISHALHRGVLAPDSDWTTRIEHRVARYKGPPGARTAEPERLLVDGRDVSREIFDSCLATTVRAVANSSQWQSQIEKYHARIIEAEPRMIAVGRNVAVALLPSADLHVALTASLAIRRERRRAQYRNSPDRSTAVGSMTPLDLFDVDAIRRLPRSVEIDTTYLPAAAVRTAALRHLEAFSR